MICPLPTTQPHHPIPKTKTQTPTVQPGHGPIPHLHPTRPRLPKRSNTRRRRQNHKPDALQHKRTQTAKKIIRRRLQRKSQCCEPYPPNGNCGQKIMEGVRGLQKARVHSSQAERAHHTSRQSPKNRTADTRGLTRGSKGAAHSPHRPTLSAQPVPAS